MRRTPLKTAAFALALGGGLAVAALSFAASSTDIEPPYWAFTIGSYMTEARNHHPGDQIPLAVPNSDVILSRGQTTDIFKVPDWHPDEHPKPPNVVMYGRKPGVYSCAYCHMPNGMGIPESAALAGLPADYIIRQVKAFKSGERSTVKPDMISYRGMAGIAKVITDEELQAAAAYFSSLKPKSWITVIETDVVPKTHADQYTLFSNHDGQSEPIGDRVIEIPKDDYLYDLHDSGSGFIAYVPTGSIERGERIATTGDNGRTQPCVSCHGPDLRGTSIAPPIAGRGPSNIVRQLYNIQHGARNGMSVMPMKSVVAPLTETDMVAIAAYVSSRKP